VANFARDTVRTLLTQGVMIGAGLLSGVLTARILGPEGRGIFSLCLAVATTATLFGGFELGQAMVYFRGRKGASEKGLAGAALLAPILFAVLTLAVMALTWPLLSKPLGVLSPDLLILALVLIPVGLSGTAMRQLFRAFDRFDLFNGLRVLVPLARVTMIAVAFLLGAGIWGAVAAVLAAEVIVMLVSFIVLVRFVRPDIREGLRNIPGLFRFGARVESATALGYASYRVSLFAVAYYLAPNDIAFYAVADGLVMQIGGLPMIIGTVLLPKISHSSGDQGSEMTAVAHRITFFMIVCLVLVVALVGPWLVVGLYGEDFAPVLPVLWVLLAGVVFQAGSRVLSPYMVAVNRIDLQVLAQGVSLALQVVLLVIWIPRWGVVGAAWASATALVLRWVVYVIAFRIVSKVPLRQTLLISTADLSRLWTAARSQIRPSA
jgi:O-antigen/teichoic acid export membrane protein